MVVQKTGLLTFSMQGSWDHPTLSTNSTPGSGSPQTPTPTQTQDPISLELTVTAPQATVTTTAPTTSTPTSAAPTAKALSNKYTLATPPSSPPTTTDPATITKKFTLSSGQSCTLQIPVQAVGSILKLKYDNPNKSYNDSLNTQGNGGATTTPTSRNSTTTTDPTPVGITLKSFAWSLVLIPGEIEKTTSTTPSPQP